MAGLDPAIHVFPAREKSKTWMPGSSPGMTSFNRRDTAQFLLGPCCLNTDAAVSLNL
jgi:hypothetical protein